MPQGWQVYFDAKQAGRNWGIKIKCPFCPTVPPTTFYDKVLKTDVLMSHYRRIRWMMVHIASHKPRELKELS